MKGHKISRSGWVLVAVLGLTSTPNVVSASDTPTKSSSAKQSEKVDPNKKVCKKIKPTGSHLPKRVCLKKKEWDAIGKQAREDMRNVSSDSRGSFSK